MNDRGELPMSDKKRNVLVPSYMQQFSCIGTACEDTCCVGWSVNIDQATYKKYSKVKEIELTPLLDKKVTRNRSNPSEVNYAKIKMDTGRCPILSEDGLCKIQAKLGEDYLSDTCAIYPRVSNVMNEVLERSATMSCPEIARLALLNPDGIDFEVIEESVDVRNVIAKRIDSRTAASNKVEKYFAELRVMSIEILQNRKYTLADRLVILGMFFHRAQDYIDAKRLDELPNLIAEYTRYIHEGAMDEGLRQIPLQYAIQMELVKELADEGVLHGIKNNRYAECLIQYVNGINYTPDTNIEELAERYQAAYELYYKPFMDQHEYMLENYLVNYAFKSLFPLGGHSTVVEAYMMMVVHYAMVKLHLIGMAGYHKSDFHIDHVVKLIQSFAKTVEHNNNYLRRIMQLLKDNNYISMAYMAILIKN
jgi:lysine-N-methylase